MNNLARFRTRVIAAIISSAVRLWRPCARAVPYLLAVLFLTSQPDAARLRSDTSAPTTGPVIVIGFVGGYVRPDDNVHGVVQLATRLRKDFQSNVFVETVENHREPKAREDILRLLDIDHAGQPSNEERRNARIIIYGHSWGGSETVTLARDLQKDGIPVLLTVQVDSIAKRGENDGIIPANVAQAVNFYQLNGYLHGRAEIRAADATRTKIIGNFRYDYATNQPNCDQYPWYDRVFMKAHTEMECDPEVWNRVESLIRSELPQPK